MNEIAVLLINIWLIHENFVLKRKRISNYSSAPYVDGNVCICHNWWIWMNFHQSFKQSSILTSDIRKHYGSVMNEMYHFNFLYFLRVSAWHFKKRTVKFSVTESPFTDSQIEVELISYKILPSVWKGGYIIAGLVMNLLKICCCFQ